MGWIDPVALDYFDMKNLEIPNCWQKFVDEEGEEKHFIGGDMNILCIIFF